MSILGNFPAAPAKELPEGIVGYLHYNLGEKLPLTKVEVLPDTVALLKTITGSSKPLYISVGTASFDIVTEDGYCKTIDYDGNVLSSNSVGYPLTAMGGYFAYGCFAYSSGSYHYLKTTCGSKWNWTCSEHKAKIISCSGNAMGPTLSADESGVVLCHDGEYVSSSNYSHVLKWSTTIEGCVAVYENYCAAAGTVIKLLSPLDGSVIAEVDTGHNIVKITSSQFYCDDGYVGQYSYSRQSVTDADSNVTGYTGTVSVSWLRNFGKNVNHLYSSNGKYIVCFADGTVSKFTSDFETEVWSYKANTVAASLAGAYGYVAGPNVVVARADGNVEIFTQSLSRVKVYFNEEAV